MTDETKAAIREAIARGLAAPDPECKMCEMPGYVYGCSEPDGIRSISWTCHAPLVIVAPHGSNFAQRQVAHEMTRFWNYVPHSDRPS